MSEDKVIFLTIPFISDKISIAYAKSFYNELINKLSIVDAWPFDTILNHFNDDKINRYYVDNDSAIAISHPSYSEALLYLLSYRRENTKSGKVINYAINEIAETHKVDWAIGHFLISYYGQLPDDVKNLLLGIRYDQFTASYILSAIKQNPAIVPSNVRDQLLLAMVSHDPYMVISAVTNEIIDTLPDRGRTLLLEFAENKDKRVLGVLILYLTCYYTQMHKDVQSLLFKLSENKEMCGKVAREIIIYFDRVPKEVQNLLYELANKKEDSEDIGWELNGRFESLPESMRNELLAKLANNKEGSKVVAIILIYHFDNVPENIRNEILMKIDLDNVPENISYNTC